MMTLTLLKVLFVATMAWITALAFQRSLWWGAFFLATPLLYLVLRGEFGTIAALLTLGLAHAWLLRKRWRTVRVPTLIAAALLAIIGVFARESLRLILP